ncbi:MAG: UDP-3-O-acyl-N-acetylglucosamine deacetylase [Planctomycetales bacterium]|nr:UDP-3-O-acyl-N-acetylglucosamine deacetylase [Planctomycetales bacterium]
MRQRTIAREAGCRGVGLHTGAPVRLRVLPAPADSGIAFVRTDLPGTGEIRAEVQNLADEPRRTALVRDGASVHTVEHLLSAALGLGIGNLRVELDGPELPGMDGSAADFVALLDRAGIRDLDAPRREIRVTRPLEEPASNGGRARVRALPSADGGLTVTYLLEHPGTPIGRQELTVAVTEETFRSGIAPARTFCLLAEAEALRAAGLGKGATTENTLVVGPDGVVGNRLRFPDEFVRHKILDLLGDLALAGGAAVRAHVVAERSGHAQNRALVRRLLAGAGSPVTDP